MTSQTQWSNALLNPERKVPDGLMSWNGSDPAQRFDVYRNNVTVSLIDALADTFPVCLALVGEAFFRAMVREFVRMSPPTSPVLSRYGHAFVIFAAEFEPARSVPYLADVARLEMAVLEALNAADDAGVTAVDFAQALADTEGLPDLCLAPRAMVHVVASPYAIVSLWAAHQGDFPIGSVDPYIAENALLWRQNFAIRMFRLSAADSAFLQAILRDEALGAAAQAALEVDSGFDLGNCLSLLIRESLIAAIKRGRKDEP